MHETLKDIVVIYHKNCPDGFAAAWSAWKKFGDTASYIAASYSDAIPEEIAGKEVYVLDFSYDEMRLPLLESQAKKLVVLDHHKGAETHVKATKEHVFDIQHSGAYLAWTYFHPETPVPLFIEYISDGDRNVYTRQDSRSICTYLCSTEKTFDAFEKVYHEMEDEHNQSAVVEKGELLMRYRDFVTEPGFNSVHFIELKGVVVPAVNAVFPMDEKSYLIQRIYTKYPPVAMSYRYDEGEWKCSLRSDGDFDCTVLAKQFGGSGHPGASGFSIQAAPGVFPFTVVPNPFDN